jgi:hypothetical protein
MKFNTAPLFLSLLLALFASVEVATAQTAVIPDTGTLTTDPVSQQIAQGDQMAMHGQAIGLIASTLNTQIDIVQTCRAGAGSSAIQNGEARDQVVVGCNIEFLANGVEAMGLLHSEYVALAWTVAGTHKSLRQNIDVAQAAITANAVTLSNDRDVWRTELLKMVGQDVPPAEDPIARFALKGALHTLLTDKRMQDEREADLLEDRDALEVMEGNVRQIQVVEAIYRFEATTSDNARRTMEHQMNRYAERAEQQAMIEGIKAGLNALPDVRVIRETFVKFDDAREVASDASAQIFGPSAITPNVDVPVGDSLEEMMEQLRALAAEDLAEVSE